METTTKTPNTPKKKQKSKWIRYKYPSRPEVFEAFSGWMAYPKSVRNPKDQQSFAKIHEVSPDTLSDYKKKPEFWKEVNEKKEKLKIDIEMKIEINKIFKEIEEQEKKQIEEHIDDDIIVRMKKYI